MTYVAIGTLVVACIVAFSGASLTRSLIRQQARERETLLNQIMYLAGRTWQEPPSATWTAPSEEVDPDRYVSSGGSIVEDF